MHGACNHHEATVRQQIYAVYQHLTLNKVLDESNPGTVSPCLHLCWAWALNWSVWTCATWYAQRASARGTACTSAKRTGTTFYQPIHTMPFAWCFPDLVSLEEPPRNLSVAHWLLPSDLKDRSSSSSFFDGCMSSMCSALAIGRNHFTMWALLTCTQYTPM